MVGVEGRNPTLTREIIDDHRKPLARHDEFGSAANRQEGLHTASTLRTKTQTVLLARRSQSILFRTFLASTDRVARIQWLCKLVKKPSKQALIMPRAEGGTDQPL
jgi:hypothetical protein